MNKTDVSKVSYVRRRSRGSMKLKLISNITVYSHKTEKKLNF